MKFIKVLFNLMHISLVLILPCSAEADIKLGGNYRTIV